MSIFDFLTSPISVYRGCQIDLIYKLVTEFMNSNRYNPSKWGGFWAEVLDQPLALAQPLSPRIFRMGRYRPNALAWLKDVVETYTATEKERAMKWKDRSNGLSEETDRWACLPQARHKRPANKNDQWIVTHNITICSEQSEAHKVSVGEDTCSNVVKSEAQELLCENAGTMRMALAWPKASIDPLKKCAFRLLDHVWPIWIWRTCWRTLLSFFSRSNAGKLSSTTHTHTHAPTCLELLGLELLMVDFSNAWNHSLCCDKCS